MSLRKGRSGEVTGFLDHGTAVTGELRFSGALRIEGEFHGSIATEDVLTVGRHAQVHADIRAGEVEIHGRVSGSVEATRRIEVFSTGKVRGDLAAPTLVIEEGAVLDGRSRMTEARERPEAGADRESLEGVDEVN